MRAPRLRPAAACCASCFCLALPQSFGYVLGQSDATHHTQHGTDPGNIRPRIGAVLCAARVNVTPISKGNLLKTIKGILGGLHAE